MGALVFKTDQYRKSRGGYSRWLEIRCRKCKNVIAIYQKDGPGNLRRLYLDRILFPGLLARVQKRPLLKIPVLKCSRYHEVLGTPCLYQDAVTKKIKELGRRS